MPKLARNSLVFLVALVLWVFFYVPNPWLHFLNVYGLDGALPTAVLYVVIPLVISVGVGVALIGDMWERICLALSIPVLGAILCLASWLLGTISDEGLMGAWLLSLPPVVPFLIGLMAVLWLRGRTVRSAQHQ
jgi:hypothetical protein